ncbi:MAG: Y-family DNA polymerase [Clostridia bacterium]|nr:Y-family DNA polymerase [Clostridia bacterium]
MADNRTKSYICIDLKSFYASVECVTRGLDPLTTNLVVADSTRTEKTICLAVTPSLKAFGISGRARLFEVVQKVKEINENRLRRIPLKMFSCKSADASEIKTDHEAEIDFIIAPPRMAHYMEISTQIYSIYLRYIAPEDIHVYSVDEVFIDATAYLTAYQCTPHELAIKMIRDILEETGITATAGIGTNMYLAKIAMDISAKHIPPDKDGVRIAELDEMSYRRSLWEHEPLTDFWRVGRGYAAKLKKYGIHTMGDIARCSVDNEELLYQLFGINAELLIDHAWGIEPCTMEDIKNFKPQSKSISQGQVLSCPYDFEKARLIIREMTELLVLDLVDKRLAADQIVLTVGYDIDNKGYSGEFETDRYGRKVPKQAHGSINLDKQTSSLRHIIKKTLELFDRIVNKKLLVRRMYVVANHTVSEDEITNEPVQLSLFDDYEETEKAEQDEKKERSLQETVIRLRKKLGKNSVVKGMNLQEGATTINRNKQIGGHKA